MIGLLAQSSSGPDARSGAAAPSQILLVSLTHPTLAPFNLDTGTLSIGRDPGADVCIDSPNVSRLHAMVRAIGDRVELIDARSSNGTWLNGKRIDRATLRLDDVIRVGDDELKVIPRPSHDLEPILPEPASAESGGAIEAAQALAEERRQLAVLFSIALRFLALPPEGSPTALFFELLDRVVSFDAAFLYLRTVDRPEREGGDRQDPEADGFAVLDHPAGLRIRAEHVRELLAARPGQTAEVADGADDALTLSSGYRAASRALFPLGGGAFFGLLAGVPGAFSREADFLAQLARVLRTALAARGALP